MNTFLKTVVGVAYIAGTASTSYAAAPVLASKDACTSKAACIDDLSGYINTFDGLTEIKDLGGPIETAQEPVYGGLKDGKVSHAETIHPTIKFLFPSSKPELDGRGENNGAPGCTTVGSVPMRASSPFTEEDVRNGRGMTAFGFCMYDANYDVAFRAAEEYFQSYDINKDDVISKADDLNNDNMITLEDALLVK